MHLIALQSWVLQQASPLLERLRIHYSLLVEHLVNQEHFLVLDVVRSVVGTLRRVGHALVNGDIG